LICILVKANLSVLSWNKTSLRSHQCRSYRAFCI